MMRALLRPGWIITHVVVIAIAVSFTSFGMWQIRRHGEVATENERIAEQLAGAPIPLDEALGSTDFDLLPTLATGVWLGDDEITLSPRSRNERPGLDLLTPLQLDDGRTLLVNRGWIPLDSEPPPAPADPQQIVGLLRESGNSRQVLRDDAGLVTSMSGVDVAELTDQIPDLIPDVYLELVDEPAREAGAFPRPASPVLLSAGPHIGYAVQWFAFTTIGLIGYPLLLRRRITEFKDGDSSK